MSLFDKLKNWSTRIMRIPAFPAITLAILCIITYFPTLQNEFKLDDLPYLNGSASLHLSSVFDIFFKSENQHYHPLNILFNILSFKLFGNNIILFHSLILMLFFLNCVLLEKITFRLSNSRLASFLTAGFFCIHPINAVIINQNILCGFFIAPLFFQISFWQFDQFLLKRSQAAYLIALFFALLASLTLETCWILPVYLLLWAYLIRKQDLRKSIIDTVPFWAITIVLFAMWQWISHGSSLASDSARKLSYLNLTPVTFLGSLIFMALWYIQKIFVPIDIVWIYSITPLDQTSALIFILFISICFLTFFYIRKRLFSTPKILFALLWFCAGFVFLPSGSLAHPESNLVIEPYWFYLSSMGVFMIFGLIIKQFKDDKSVQIIVSLTAVLGMFLFLQTRAINMVARTEKSYCEYWMKVSPNPVPLTTLAKIATREGKYTQAVSYYQLYLHDYSNSAYASFWPWEVFVSMASVYCDAGDFKAAKYWADKALLSNPRDPRPYIVLGSLSVREKNLTEAEEYYSKAIVVSPENKLAKLNLADLYLMDQKEKLAIPLLIQLTNSHLIRNEKVNVFAKLAALQYRYVSNDEAQSTINLLLSQEPEAKSYFILSQAFSYFHLPEQSMSLLKLGLQRYPSDNDLNVLYQQMGGKL